MGYRVSLPKRTHAFVSLFRDSHLLLSVLLTAVLMFMHYFPLIDDTFLSKWIQLLLCTPVYIIGWMRMGRNGIGALLRRTPNMNTLVFISTSVAFFYSTVSLCFGLDGEFIFFETTASIISFVLLGNYLERYASHLSRKEINSLVTAMDNVTTRLGNDGEQMEEVEAEVLDVGDTILIKTGERVPVDCVIVKDRGVVSEALLTGESTPLEKEEGDRLLSGSVLEQGTLYAKVLAPTHESTLQHIIQIIERAQAQKAPIQRLVDRISAVFVPVVLCLSVVTYLANVYVFFCSPTEAMLRAIAVIVIACPCALGMATPAAVAIGFGIAAKKGIYFKYADNIEKFNSLRKVILDKTGTLTTGVFVIKDYQSSLPLSQFKQIVMQLAEHSNHPLSKSIVRVWKEEKEMEHSVQLAAIEEQKGIGMQGTFEGNVYQMGSEKVLHEKAQENHNLYISKNGVCVGWIDMQDEIRSDAKQLVESLHKEGIRTILLSGDRQQPCRAVSTALGIKTFYSDQLPDEKQAKLRAWSEQSTTAMVGDGINDAPSLAEADIGISFGRVSQLNLQSASVVIARPEMRALLSALRIGKHTYQTIKANLCWAFGYNVIAIPIAAIGILTPYFAALLMGLSDVILVFISLTLYLRKH